MVRFKRLSGTDSSNRTTRKASSEERCGRNLPDLRNGYLARKLHHPKKTTTLPNAVLYPALCTSLRRLRGSLPLHGEEARGFGLLR